MNKGIISGTKMDGFVDPAFPQQLATKAYVDNAFQGRANTVSGEWTYDRRLATGSTIQLTGGNQRFIHFTAAKTETITQCQTFTGGVAAATTTLARIGVYELSNDGLNLILVASTANATTLWNATYSTFTRTFTNSFVKVKGREYAFSMLWTGTTAPQFVGFTFGASTIAYPLPRLCGNLAGKTDLAASPQIVANIGGFNHVPIGVLLP